MELHVQMCLNYQKRVELKRIWTMKIQGGSFFKITPGLKPHKHRYG